MPDFMDVDDPVATTNGFFQFWRAPRAGEGALVVVVFTYGGPLHQLFAHVFLHAETA